MILTILKRGKKNKEEKVFIKLADVVSEEDATKFLYSLDYEEIYSACLCKDNGVIIHQIILGGI